MYTPKQPHDADFIDIAATVSEAALNRYNDEKRVLYSLFDKRLEALTASLHAQLTTLADEIAGDFDLLLYEYRESQSPPG